MLVNISIAVFICAFTYWMLQLKKFEDNNEENKSVSAQPFFANASGTNLKGISKLILEALKNWYEVT